MKILTFNDKKEIKEILDNNYVIAFPTETVFGFGANAYSVEAYNNLVDLKDRDENKPFTLLCSNYKQILKHGVINKLTKNIIEKFTPGPLTILVKKKKKTPHYLTLNSEYIGFRIPDFKELLDLLNYLKYPLLCPSANKKNEKPCQNLNEIINKFNNEILLKCGIKYDKLNNSNISSTVIKIIDEHNIELIREGQIKFEDILREIKNENSIRL